MGGRIDWHNAHAQSFEQAGMCFVFPSDRNSNKDKKACACAKAGAEAAGKKQIEGGQ